MVHLHSIIKEPAFALNCPRLFAIATAYEKYAKSYVLMFTWGDSLWMHVDMRASQTAATPASQDKNSWAAAKESRAKGAGAKDDLVVGHSVTGGAQRVAYANAPAATPLGILGLAKWRTPPEATSYLRQAGSLSAVPAAAHSGAMALCDDGRSVVDVPWEEGACKPRMCRSASATGPLGYNVSLLAMVSPRCMPLLLLCLLKLDAQRRLRLY